jgi:hypothetical protein
MQIAKYTSSKETINNFFRNTAYNDLFNYGDAAYWTYEAMELIGHPLQYIPKVIGHKEDPMYDLGSTNVGTITPPSQVHPATPHTHLTTYTASTNLGHYRVKLPADFHKLIAVAVDGVLALPTQNMFHHLLDGSCCGYDTDAMPTENFYDNFGNTFSPQALPLNTRIVSNPPQFSLNNNYITFDIKEGKVCMAYWAFPLDEEGYPLVPDDVKYKRAIASYIQMRMDYILWRQEMLSDKVFLKSEEDWKWNVASASSHLKMPDITQMESLRRQLTKMIVRTEDFRTAFSSMNTRGHRGRY